MSKSLTKGQLAAALADRMGADRKTATAALDALAALVADEVKAGGTVTLPGLVKVTVRERPQREVRNPATGETLTKPADRAIKVSAVKALKDATA